MSAFDRQAPHQYQWFEPALPIREPVSDIFNDAGFDKERAMAREASALLKAGDVLTWSGTRLARIAAVALLSGVSVTLGLRACLDAGRAR